MGAKSLSVFSVVGSALHFSSRRFETVLRVSALPIALLLVFNMAAGFAYLSVAYHRVITFRDVAAAGASWDQIAKLANTAAWNGLQNFSVPVWATYLASLAVSTVLVASFMAPLIRFAGLGERPSPGLLRIAFGAAQIRFIFASFLSFLLAAIVVYFPVSAATFAIIGVVSKAMTTPYANFPDAASLHSVDIVAGRDAMAMRGDLWIYEYGYWSGAALLIAILVAIVLVLHVRPRDEDQTSGVGLLGRTLGVLSGLAVYFGAVAVFAAQVKGAFGVEWLSMILFCAAALAAAAFLNLRLYPYAGVAVCRGRMGFGGTFRVTRRFDVARLALAFALLGAILTVMWILLVALGGGAALAMFGSLAAASESFARLASGGEGGGWVAPLFRWLWALINIAFTILWTAFTYGVAAGLLGRLYRESER